MDSEILLYHPVKTKTFYLNETASLIWWKTRWTSPWRASMWNAWSVRGW